MKWEGNRQSSNVEDRRGSGGSGGFGGRGIGIGTLLVALIGGMLFGIDPLTMLSMMAGDGSGVRQEQPASPPPPGDERAAFVSTVLADTEDVWTTIMTKKGS